MIKIFDHSTFYEERGEIFSFYKHKNIEAYLDRPLIEDRCSISYRGTVRGFHGDPLTYKYITCPIGELKLIVYDLKNKITEQIILSEDRKQSVLIPPFHLNAHQCLSHQCMFLYKQSEYYETFPAEKQWTVRYDDEDIAPNWPLKPLRISDRDLAGKSLKELLKEIQCN